MDMGMKQAIHTQENTQTAPKEGENGKDMPNRMPNILQNILPKITQTLQKHRYATLVLAVGVVLLCMQGGTSSEDVTTPTTAAVQAEGFDRTTFETQLASVLGCVANVGAVEVMVTLENDGERVYASENYATEAVEEITLATVSDGSYGEQAVERYATYPAVRGVVVVCEGAGSDTVKLAVMQAVMAVCGVQSDVVQVLEMAQ